MSGESLGERMKQYEEVSRVYLTRRLPVIIRVDGKAFHTFTKGFQKPFDEILMSTMQETAMNVAANIQGCKLAYTQSDEISFLLTDDDTITTSAWFDKNLQKMVSLSASLTTLAFNTIYAQKINALLDMTKKGSVQISEKQCVIYKSKIAKALFDSRAFVLPKEEVVNMFIWRQQDATRNATQMVGQANFSHKELQGKSCDQIQEMLFQKRGINFNDLPTEQKRGVCIIKKGIDAGSSNRRKWTVDKEIPIFTQDRNYIERLLNHEAEKGA